MYLTIPIAGPEFVIAPKKIPKLVELRVRILELCRGLKLKIFFPRKLSGEAQSQISNLTLTNKKTHHRPRLILHQRKTLILQHQAV